MTFTFRLDDTVLTLEFLDKLLEHKIDASIIAGDSLVRLDSQKKKLMEICNGKLYEYGFSDFNECLQILNAIKNLDETILSEYAV